MNKGINKHVASYRITQMYKTILQKIITFHLVLKGKLNSENRYNMAIKNDQ